MISSSETVGGTAIPGSIPPKPEACESGDAEEVKDRGLKIQACTSF